MNEKQAKRVVLMLTILVALHGTCAIALLWTIFKLLQPVNVGPL